MTWRSPALLVVLFLVPPCVEAGTPEDEGRGRTRVMAGYRSLGASRDELDLGFCYGAGSYEVGWQFTWRRHRPGDPALSGEQFTAGLLWSWLPVRGRAGGLRLDIDPWASVSTSVREIATQAVIELPYGVESRASLYATLRLGPLRLSPSVAVVGKLARATRTTEIVTKGSDREGSWRVSLPLVLGEHLRLEGAYSRAWKTASYLGQERSQFTVGWVF